MFQVTQEHCLSEIERSFSDAEFWVGVLNQNFARKGYYWWLDRKTGRAVEKEIKPLEWDEFDDA